MITTTTEPAKFSIAKPPTYLSFAEHEMIEVLDALKDALNPPIRWTEDEEENRKKATATRLAAIERARRVIERHPYFSA